MALDTRDSATSGCPVLDSAHAVLDCTVVSRMEAGDHWLVYGQVTDGEMRDDAAMTAVHYRKLGNHY